MIDEVLYIDLEDHKQSKFRKKEKSRKKRERERERQNERTNEYFINEGNGISTILFLFFTSSPFRDRESQRERERILLRLLILSQRAFGDDDEVMLNVLGCQLTY